MKYSRISSATVRALLAFCAVTVALLAKTSFGHLDAFSYDPEEWQSITRPSACDWVQSEPDTGVYNISTILPTVPSCGYPYHYTLIQGINDTLEALISLHNRTHSSYDLIGKDIDHWFAPQVYDLLKADSGSPPLIDSTKLGHRIRGWYSSGIRHPSQSKLPAQADWYGIKMDIWKLPEGQFQICLLSTDIVPKDFIALTSGGVFEFRPAYNLADSCNAYEGLYWRATDDSNFTAAKTWADKIILINPKSVPGWWLKAMDALNRKDTTAAKNAYDEAIANLNSAIDPAMPDSNKRAITYIEKKYLRWLNTILPYNRAQLGP